MSATRSTSSRTSCRSTTCLPSRSRGGWIISPTTPLPGNSCVTARSAADLLRDARAGERAARIPEAIASYEAAIAAAERVGEHLVLAEALRRLAVVRHRRGDSADARELCRRSHAVSRHAGDTVLAGEALNTLGGIDLETDAIADAREHFLRALELGGQSRELRARAEQNLGILANIQGDFDEALARYRRSLDAYRASNDEHGCAIAYHNLGMASADLHQLDDAERYFGQSYEIAERAGDLHLQGLCLVNHADVHLERERYDEAQRNAEGALVTFDRLGALSDKADAYRVLGMVFRETGRPALAVARALGMDQRAQTTLRLGAYLHDLGKVRVPHEILNKPGPLTRNELEVVQMHPIWGIELLAGVEFPWDLKPIIRWHHERYDGTGYPDRLRGDAIPLAAQIVGIVDVYDALTTTRPYRAAFSRAAALARIESCRRLWSETVYRAFLVSLAQPQTWQARAHTEQAPFAVPA